MAAFGKALASSNPNVSVLGMAADWLQEKGFHDMGQILSEIFVMISDKIKNGEMEYRTAKDLYERYHDVWHAMLAKGVSEENGMVSHKNKYYRLGTHGEIFVLDAAGWDSADDVPQEILAALVYLVGEQFIEEMEQASSHPRYGTAHGKKVDFDNRLWASNSLRMLQSVRRVADRLRGVETRGRSQETLRELNDSIHMANSHLEKLIGLFNSYKLGKRGNFSVRIPRVARDNIVDARGVIASLRWMNDFENYPWVRDFTDQFMMYTELLMDRYEDSEDMRFNPPDFRTN